MTARRRWTKGLTRALLGLAVLLPAGCAKDVTFSRYPDFDVPEGRTVAVAPFRAPEDNPQAGRTFAKHLAEALRDNGTYRVVSPETLVSTLDDAAGDQLTAGDPRRAARAARRLEGVDLVLTGTVHAYQARRYVHNRATYEPIYIYQPGYYGALYGASPWPDPFVYAGRSFAGYETTLDHEAEVSVSAALVDVAEGSALARTPQAESVRVVSSGRPPKLSTRECLSIARRRVIDRLLEHLAVTSATVELKPDKAIRTASGRPGGQWNFTDDFTPADKKLFVVLTLPPQASRNRLRLVITPEDSSRELAAREITWPAGDTQTTRGYEFDPAELTAAGPDEDFEAKLFRGGELLIKTDFEIE